MQLFSQFLFHRWGFAALLVLTLLAGLVLNVLFLLSFAGNERVRRMPNWPLMALSVRDVIVALVLIPICIGASRDTATINVDKTRRSTKV